MLTYDFMQRALIAAALVGVIAPMVGAFLVQRRLALLGDGMGHVALTGVGLALLFGAAPLVAALAAAGIGAFLIEYIRSKSRTAGDLALALLFYSGIAGGVLFVSLAPGGASSMLNSYLFGSLSTVGVVDVWLLVAMSALVIAVLGLLGRELFAVSIDQDAAQLQGIRVQPMNVLLSVLAAIVVVVGMRVVGLLLVSAIMVVPVAAAQQLTRSFRSTLALGAALGGGAAISGLVTSFYVEIPPGPTIVIFALASFAVLSVVAVLRRRRTSGRR